MEIQWQAIGPGEGHAAGRGLLSEMYRSATGKEMPPVCVTPRGKPYFEKSSVHFSISHSKGHVFCVLSDYPIGIDAEEKDRKIDLALAEKILSEEEYSQWILVKEKREALLKFWVLKEAWAKATGEGLRGYPKHTAFSLTDPRITEIDGCFVAVVEIKE